MWHSDDQFWKTYGPWMFTEKRWANAPGEVDSILKLLSPAPQGAILDLCCGPGRHSLELTRRGFSVVGVDRTSAYVNEAKKRAKAERLKVEFVKQDMRRFCRPQAFDAALNMFTAFGYFRNPKADQRVLLNVYRSLKPGGKLLMELMGKEVLARKFQERDWHEEQGVMFLEERKLSQGWSWIDSRWILLKGTKRKEFVVSHRLYSAKELSDLLRVCGFEKVRVHGDLAGAAYDHNARRLVIVAQKA
ncbi:MAG: class I SAM-dependent methyltransferase [Tepidisphaeraceae bacterium]|jgi:SAM-dependent methyltransferase